MLQTSQNPHCHRNQQTSAEQHVPRGRRVHHTTARRRSWRPQQAQTRCRDVFLRKRLQRVDTWQQIGLLLLHQHRPTEPFLQAPHPAMPFTVGEHHPRCTAGSHRWSGLLLQCFQAGLGERGAIDQHRLVPAIQPPRRTTTAIPIGREQPKILTDLLRRTTRLQGRGEGHGDTTQPLPQFARLLTLY